MFVRALNDPTKGEHMEILRNECFSPMVEDPFLIKGVRYKVDAKRPFVEHKDIRPLCRGCTELAYCKGLGRRK